VWRFGRRTVANQSRATFALPGAAAECNKPCDLAAPPSFQDVFPQLRMPGF
jgi:hypothetical protein